jgi:hypothetical protein
VSPRPAPGGREGEVKTAMEPHGMTILLVTIFSILGWCLR